MNWLRLWAFAGPFVGLVAGIFVMALCTAGAVTDAYRAGVRAGRGAGAKAVSGGIGDTGMGSPSDAVRLSDGGGSYKVYAVAKAGPHKVYDVTEHWGDQDFVGGWV